MVILVGALLIAAVMVSSAFTARHYQRDALRLEASEIIADAHQKHTELVGDFVGGYTERLKPWWSDQELEAFGFKDNERWIAETDKVLKGLEWENILQQPRGDQVIVAKVGISPLAQEQVAAYASGGYIGSPNKSRREARIGNASGV